MKKNILRTLSWCILCSLLVGCKKDIKVNFLMNGQDIPESETQPVDSMMIMTVSAGDTIIFTDVSNPNKSVTSRQWDIDGNGAFDSKFKDNDHFSTTFENEGVYKVKFCANGEALCISKWVKVEGLFDDFSETEGNLPMLTFNKPENTYDRSDRRSYAVEVQTTDIFSKDELTLLINNRETSFSFDDETGLLTKTVRLSAGENKIEVKANTGEEETNKLAYVEYAEGGPAYSDDDRPEKGGGSGGGGGGVLPSPDPVPPAPEPIPVAKPLPIITIIDRNLRTESQQATVKVEVDYFKGKELEVLLNGVPQTDYRRVGGRKGWSIALNLNEGSNRLIVGATNKNGKNSAETVITYNKPAPPEPTRERPLSKSCVVGIPNNQYSNFSQDCIALYTKDKYEVNLLPNQRVELQSFYVYSNDCGGLKVTLEGDGDRQNFKVSLNAGKTQILLNAIDAELAGQKSYKLILEPIGNYRGCNASSAPRLEKVTDCVVSSKNCNAFKLDQSSNPILYDLKIKY